MKIRISSISGFNEDLEVADFVQAGLDGSDYGRGSLETVEATTRNLVESYARLIDNLVSKGQLSAEEVHHIVKGWPESDVSFIGKDP